MTAIMLHESAALISPASYPVDRNPALVYLASLATSSRRPMSQSLNAIASILGFADLLSVPWGALRYEHTQAIRTQLASYLRPAWDGLPLPSPFYFILNRHTLQGPFARFDSSKAALQ